MAAIMSFSRVYSSVLRTNTMASRLFSTGPCMMAKNILHTEEGNRIVVEGVPVPSSTSTITTSTCREGQAGCHPFCRSPIVGQVKHTDVLILDQFVDSRGQMYSQEELGICLVGDDGVDVLDHDHGDVAEAVDQAV